MGTERARRVSLTVRIIRALVALCPWILALFLLFQLEHGGAWAVDQPFRPVISVLILAIGLGLSFVVHSSLSRPRQR